MSALVGVGIAVGVIFLIGVSVGVIVVIALSAVKRDKADRARQDGAATAAGAGHAGLGGMDDDGWQPSPGDRPDDGPKGPGWPGDTDSGFSGRNL